MSLYRIVLKNLRQRSLSTLLTITSVVLGVSLIIAITVVQKQTRDSYSQTSVGYDLILAAKGSQLQTTLNAIYHLETSTGIIPYELYEFAQRDPRIEHAFPLYVGDSYGGFRVVGTSTEFLDLAEPRRGKGFEFAEGKNFSEPLQAVLGSEVARRTGLQIGDEIQLAHGLSEPLVGAEALVHDNAPVVIVGILKPSNTANDRVLFADLYTTHALHDPLFHLDDLDDDHDHSAESDSSEVELSLTERITLKEMDALLLKMKDPAAALQLSGMINYPTPANPLLARNMMRDPFFRYKDQIMAVIPAMQIMALMSIVGNAEVILEYVAWFVIIVAMFGVLIALYNTMDSRKHDIAVMRALGASKKHVFTIIVLEAVTITGLGAILGLLAGHLIVYAVVPYLAGVAGIVITAFKTDSDQWSYMAMIILLGALSGLIPAFKAYQTQVTKYLGSGK
jgi:putative ABC transport system permease protein